MHTRALVGSILLFVASSLPGCAKGKTDLTTDAKVGSDARGDLWQSDGLRPDGARPDGPLADGPRPDVLAADVRAPDVLAPDILAPDILPPDILAPDTMPQGSFKAPFTLDFEANGGGLTATGDWAWGALAFSAGTNCDSTPLPPAAAHSGTHLWGTVLNDCYTPATNAESCSTSDVSNDSVLSIEVTLPASWTLATLSYWQWFDVFTSFDYGEIRVNGAVVTQFCTGTIPGDSGTWEKVSVDLSAHVGKKVTIAFNFAATGVVQNAGWYIDDLSVNGS